MAGETILVLNGPNLNLLGIREPELYGTETLAEIEEACLERAAELELKLDFRHSNHEGELVTWIQDARSNAAGIVINAGAYSHTSIAIMDALKAAEMPIVEVHLSNIFRREAFRHASYVSMAAKGVICGLGSQGYLLALDALWRLLQTDDGEA
jgi:3-dehydroquinate dehydratase II